MSNDTSPYLSPLCHRTWISHYQHNLLPSLQLHDLWMIRRGHSNAWNQPSNPSLPFPAHNPSTRAHHSWGVWTGAASTPPDWNPPHHTQHSSSFPPRLWEPQRFWSLSSFLPETDWGIDQNKTLTWTTWSAMFWWWVLQPPRDQS